MGHHNDNMIRISLTIFFVSCALLMSARNLFNVKQQDQTRLCEGFVEEMDYATDIEKGMGRVVLKKNMVDGVNTLTQAMLGAANVVYVIKYNFTLGEDVIIPAGCVLKFEGGSIRGGRMIMNNTSIVSKKTAFYDVVIPKSSIKTENPVYLKWFSSSNDLQTLYNAVNTSNIVICEEGKIYYFTEDILDSDYNGFLYENLEIVGNHCNWVFGNHFVKYGYHTLFRICNGATVNAHNINIEWKNSYFYSNCYHLFTFDGEEFTKGECGYFKNIHIICTEDNCGFGTLVNAYYGKEFLFEDCSIEYVGNNSKQIGGSFVYIMPAYDNMSTSVEMRNCYCKCTGTDEPFTISIMWKSGQAYSSAVSRKVKATIDNCVFIKEDDANNASAFNFVEQGVGNKVDNNYVIDAIFTNCRFVAKSTNRLLTCLTQTLFRGVGNVLYSGCEFISKCSDDSLLSGNAVNDGAVLYFSPCNRNDFLTVFQNCIFEGTNNCGLINHDSYLEANVIFDKCIMNLDNIQNGLGDVATGYVQVVPTLSNCTINLKQNKLFTNAISIYQKLTNLHLIFL